MLVIEDIQGLREACDRQREEGHRVGLVPTMGFLHEGHLALVRRALSLSDFVVVSIFVNPTQFGPAEDLGCYPRDMEGDLEKCRAEGAQMVFCPDAGQMYPAGFQSHVEVEEISQGLCGASRPTHFRGVSTVVTKLVNIVGPCVAVFGEKDFQQLRVIRQMALDLNLPVEILGHPIIREPDGLAMSSRNAYLNPQERVSATCLRRALLAIKERVSERGGSVPAAEAVALARGIMEAEPGVRVDYLEVRDADRFTPGDEVREGRSVVLAAAFVGCTRLIDNLVV